MPYHDTYMWNLKFGTNEPFYRRERDSKTENRLVVAKGERGVSGRDWEFGDRRIASQWGVSGSGSSKG